MNFIIMYSCFFFQVGNVQVWRRPVLPEGSYAIAFLNTGTDGAPSKVSVKLQDLGLNNAKGYSIAEVFDGDRMGDFKPQDRLKIQVNPTGVFFVKATKLF